MICSQPSPVLHRVRLNKAVRAGSFLAHKTPYHLREKPPAPYYEKLAEFFVGKPSLLPVLDHPDETHPKSRRGEKSHHN